MTTGRRDRIRGQEPAAWLLVLLPVLLAGCMGPIGTFESEEQALQAMRPEYRDLILRARALDDVRGRASGGPLYGGVGQVRVVPVPGGGFSVRTYGFGSGR